MQLKHCHHIQLMLFCHTFHNLFKHCAMIRFVLHNFFFASEYLTCKIIIEIFLFRWVTLLSLLNIFQNDRKSLPINLFGICKPICIWMKINSIKIVRILLKMEHFRKNKSFIKFFFFIFSCFI